MTGKEMERAIEFLLQSQASFESQLEKTNQQLELTDQRVSTLAETQTEFIQMMLQHVEAQREINASLRRTTSDLSQTMGALAEVTQQRISDLSQVVEQRISDLAQAQQQTQKDISDLTKIVGDLTKAVYRNGKPPQG